MKIAAFIPIKLNNERTPGKNTKKFYDGTPLIQLILKALIQVKELDDIYVFCSDERIKDYLLPNIKFLKRPAFLDTSQATPQDIISEFMKLVDADIYMVSHCTSPFVKAEKFADCIGKVLRCGYDSAFTAQRIQKLLWCDNQPLNFRADHIPRTQDLTPIYAELSAAYVFKKEVFLKYRRRIGINPYICECSEIECTDIDYPEDFLIADAIYKELIDK